MKYDFLRKSGVLRFQSPWGGATYDDHLRFIGKAHSGLPIAIDRTFFSLDVAVEALRAIISSNR